MYGCSSGFQLRYFASFKVNSHPVPQPAPLRRLSPTLANDLAACAYRVAWALDERYALLRRPTPWSELGVVAHACVEDIARGLLTGAHSRDEARTRVEQAWDRHLAKCQAILAEKWAPAEPPPPETWPGYHLVRARVLGRALRLFDQGIMVEPARVTAMVEQPLEDPATGIAGRPDRVEASPSGIRVVDLKTGLHQGKPTDSQRRQLLLYAHLVFIATGRRPSKVAVEGPSGERWEEDATAEIVAGAVAEVGLLRERFTAAVDEGRVDSLAVPGQETCRWCPYRLVCGPYWSNLESSWGHGSVLGAIKRRESRPGGAIIDIQAESPIDTAGNDWRVVGPGGMPGFTGQRLAVIGAEKGEGLLLRWTWSTAAQSP